MGAGKSTVGAALAKRIGVPWTDLDHAIEARSGRSIPDLFTVDGEAAFRAVELETLAGLLAEGRGPQVLSLGGGALLDPRARSLLAQHQVQVVVLGVSLEAASARIQGTGRPLAAHLGTLHSARACHYASLGPLVPTDGKAVNDVVDAILEVL